MRVLILSWEYPPHIEGGLGRHVAELAPALAKQGIETHVVTPANGPISYTLRDGLEWAPPAMATTLSPEQVVVSEENGVIVHRFALPASQNLDIYSRVLDANDYVIEYVSGLIETNQTWDLLHTHDWLTGVAATTLQTIWKLPAVATIHATELGRGRGHLHNDLQRAIDRAERDLIQHADRIIVCSHHMLGELQTFFQTPKEKVDVVPNGVNIDNLYSLTEGDLATFRKTYAAPYEKIVFTVSRLVYEKGVHRLIDAAPQILRKSPRAKIIVAGKGPEAKTLKQQAEHLGISNRVEFIGFISDQDRDRLFKVANCAVFPSLYEPFGIVALEAMALGCPVVASDVGGLSEVVTHLETGITTYPDNPDSVAWGVIQALTRPDWTQKHTTNAQQWVKEYFNWPRIAGLTADVYRRVLNQPQKVI